MIIMVKCRLSFASWGDTTRNPVCVGALENCGVLAKMFDSLGGVHTDAFSPTHRVVSVTAKVPLCFVLFPVEHIVVRL
jgi:hypothetical protein